MADKRDYKSETEDPKGAITPYNFIPMPEQIIYRYKSFEDIPKHNLRKDVDFENYKTGYIEYTVTPQTPIYIGGNGDFIKIGGRFAIPGSTMRGRVRTNAEILSASYPEFIENSRFWYRGLADRSKKLRDEYVGTLKNLAQNPDNSLEDAVKAGYMINKHGKLEIIPAAEVDAHSFARIKEARLRKMSFAEEKNEKCFMYKNVDWEVIKKYKMDKNIKAVDRVLREDAKTNKFSNEAFVPYQKSVFYKLDQENRVSDISVNQKTGYTAGYIVNSSNLGNKQVHYLIFGKNEAKDNRNVKVEHEVKANFEVSVKYARNQGKSLFNMDIKEYNSKNKADDNMKAVFYKLKPGRNEAEVIGFTPYLKIPYKYGVLDGLKNIYREPNTFDYAQSIFGMANEKSYKGRVSFSNALISEDAVVDRQVIAKELLKPNPTSFQLYLEQPDSDLNKLMNYNDENFKLRGYKFYHLKKDGDKSSSPNTGEYISKLNVILPSASSEDKKVEFRGKIFFENLAVDELGLLLYSIKPFADGFETIGQGKPYGWGKVELRIDSLNIEDIENRGNSVENKIKSGMNNNVLNEIMNNKKEDGQYRTYSIDADSNQEIELIKKTFVQKIETLASDQMDRKYRLFHYSNDVINALRYSKTKVDIGNKWNYMELRKFRDRESLATVDKLMEKELNVIRKLDEKLNQSINFMTKEDKSLPYEERVEKYRNILVLSENDSEIYNIKPVMNNFQKVTYEYFYMNKNFKGYDIIIFNNLKKELEGSMVDIAKRYPDSGYIVFNDRGERVTAEINGAYSLSNMIVTLHQSIISVSKFLDNIRRK